VDTIDEGIELLTGVPAGQKDDRGAWPEDSVNERVNRTLQDFADTLRQYKHGD
jgi:hypothetical protein